MAGKGNQEPTKTKRVIKQELEVASRTSWGQQGSTGATRDQAGSIEVNLHQLRPSGLISVNKDPFRLNGI